MNTSHGQSGTLSGQVADAVQGNWVDQIAPEWSRPYLRLSRADRPVGTWLLLIPCWWGALLAAASTGGWSWTVLWVMAGSALGAWLMRGAGCTWNDITDRKFDASVARTRSRPIPSGQVSVKGAAIWMVVQALLAFAILLTFHRTAIWLGVLSVVLVAIYPFAKRFTWWPQVFLGLAFNWGALLCWAAVTGSLETAPVILYLSGIAWTLFYDTIYAHQDKEDDALIGVRSTARLFGTRTHGWLTAFALLTVMLLTCSVLLTFLPVYAPLKIGVALGAPISLGLHLMWQLRRLDIDDPDACLHLFRTNRDAGLLAGLFLAVAAIL